MPKIVRDPNAVYCDEPTLTQQHFAEECDINEILKRSAISGQLPVNDKRPIYGDFTQVPKTLVEAYAVIKQAETLFMALPWNVRERFSNDPAKMVEFLNNPGNRKEAIELGLVVEPKADSGTSVPDGTKVPESTGGTGPAQ